MTAAQRCPACGHAAAAGCPRGHAEARSLQRRAPMQPGRGFPPFDFLSGLREVPRAALALVHERPFVGRLGRPVAVNAIAFVLLACGAVASVPALAAGLPGGRIAVAVAIACTAPPLWELLTGRAQRQLLAIAEAAMLGLPTTPPPAPARGPKFIDRLLPIVLAAVAMPLVLGALAIPYAGAPLAFVVAAALHAVAWFAAPTAACGLAAEARLATLWRNRWRALGVGSGITLASAVPFLNLLLLPSVATVAATAAFLRFEKASGG